ncbi:MAG: molybdopterin molybdotransferase MoeA [Planctomycetota bacterium]|nr:molybdopterin molybdotransferase MoeA [Planctomycetota bacterium]
MFDDVRMRGFQRRADVEEVVAWVDALPLRPRVESVALAEAAGRVLAGPLISAVDVPAFARAAMDGWALRAEATFGSSETDPIFVRVVGTSRPGRPHASRLAAGEAVRIMTGAALPDGADTVLRAEDGTQTGDSLAVRVPLPLGLHVGAIGEDVKQGTRLVTAGRVLRPQDVGLASSIGVPRLDVVAAPRVALAVTGDELLAPGATPHGTHIADANGPMLRALVQRDGGTLVRSDQLPDDESALRAWLSEVEADIVLVSGGSSVGEEDHAPRLLHELGELNWHGVALRPAAPSGAGRLAEAAAFLLPGNPVSCLCAYDFFAGRLVRRLAGHSPTWPYPLLRARLARKIASVLGRVDYVRVRIVGGRVEPVMARGASILSSTSEADGFVIVPRDHEGWPPDRDVDVFLYDAGPS